MGKAALPTEGLSDFALFPLQVASWYGGRPAAEQEVGISKCCQAMFAAAQSRAFVFSFALGIENVSSTVVSAMGRCRVMNSGFRRECRAGFNGSVLGLRFGEALKPHREDEGMLPPVACPWQTGCGLQDGWTSLAVPSRWPPTSCSCRLTPVQQPQKARNWWGHQWFFLIVFCGKR